MMKMVAAVGFLTLSLTVGAGVASAQPDTGLLVGTTCSYGQVVAALNAERPDVAPEFNSSPIAQNLLRQFLDSPPPERERIAQQMLGSPLLQDEIEPIMQVAGSCSRY